MLDDEQNQTKFCGHQRFEHIQNVDTHPEMFSKILLTLHLLFAAFGRVDK